MNYTHLKQLFVLLRNNMDWCICNGYEFVGIFLDKMNKNFQLVTLEKWLVKNTFKQFIKIKETNRNV